MRARFTFHICHDGEWEVRDLGAVIAKLPTRQGAMAFARQMALTARMAGSQASVEEIGPCPPDGAAAPGRDRGAAKP